MVTETDVKNVEHEMTIIKKKKINNKFENVENNYGNNNKMILSKEIMRIIFFCPHCIFLQQFQYLNIISQTIKN